MCLLLCMQVACGKPVERISTMDQQTREDIVQCGQGFDFDVVSGNTMSTDDFYEGMLGVCVCE